MEKKEKAVHHSLRQHFSEKKFTSVVSLKFSEIKEEVTPYKSRYYPANENNIQERSNNFGHSKIFYE